MQSKVLSRDLEECGSNEFVHMRRADAEVRAAVNASCVRDVKAHDQETSKSSRPIVYLP